MRIALWVFAILLLAGTAMAADVAKGPEVVEGIPQVYTDQYLSRADVLSINILEAVYTDFGPTYAASFTNNGLATDIIYDPSGVFDPSNYQMVVYDSSDDWWTTYAAGYALDLAVLGTYVDGGGCVMIVGQDFLYGGGAPAVNFVTTYCGYYDAVQDANWADVTMTWTATAGGFIEGLVGNQVACFVDNPYFTDDVYACAQGIIMWTTEYYGPAEGGCQDVAIFSSVEFGCEPVASLDVILGRFIEFCGGVEPTPTNNTTWGQIKAQ
jgi:hypothetical protein